MTDEKGIITRFELSFFDEPQEVGFLNGLCDAGFPDESIINLLTLFETMPAPDLDPKMRPSFWFTEFGVSSFIEEIALVQKSVHRYGWDLIYASVPARKLTEEDILYQDSYQFAITPEAVSRLSPQFRRYSPSSLNLLSLKGCS